jgi:Carboxypeptidase regulatory-like domain/TonB dependent receptor-like, beta-barrel
MRNAECVPPRWAAALVAALLVFGLAGTALAQTDVTTSRVSGTIKDAEGGVLPGVAVEVKSTETGQVRQTVTDGKGFYRVVDLPTGTYEITCTLTGFATAKKPEVRLVLGSSPTVDFTMQVAGAAESITVTSEVPLVEVTSTTAATTVPSEQLTSLPLSGRDFLNMVLLTPETRRDAERNGLSISGQRGINTNITVDGVDFNNPFFGGQAAGAEGRAPLSISQESVKEFSVITNGASVEFGRSGGGFVNVITKSGTNQFHGSAFYYTQPNSMISDRADGTQLNDQNKKQYGASLGGPIFRDKLFFFTSYDTQDATENFAVNSNVINPDVFAKYPELTSDPSFNKGTNARVFFGRMDFLFSGSHRLTGRYNYTDYLGENATNTDPRNSTNYNGIEHMWARSYVAAYSGMFGTNWLNDTNAQWYSEYTPREDKSPTLVDVRTTTPSIRWGAVYFLPITSTVERKNLTDTVTYLHGDHVFKGGLDYNDTSVSQTFKGDWRGVYTFTNPTGLIAGKWTQFYQFIGLNGITAAEAGTIDMTQKELAFFVQDQWFITPKLTASLGIRWENLDNPNGAVLNPFDKNADGSFNLTGHIPDVNNQWSPRLGLTWSPGEGKTVLRMSAGRYWSRTPAILFAQLYSSNALRGARYTINAGASGPTDPLAPGWGANFDPTDVAPLDYSNVTTKFKGLDVYAVNPDFTNPYTDRVTLGFDRELFKDTALTLDVTYAKGHQLQRLSDWNLQYEIDPATGQPKKSTVNGMPVYSKTRPNTQYGKVIVNISDAYSEYFGTILTIQRRFTERVFGFVSVTYSKDKDIDDNERNYAGVQFEDVNNRANQWGYSRRDQTWKYAVSGVWNTPWWGLTASGVWRYLSGFPYTPVTSTDVNQDNFFNDRPTINGDHLARNSYRWPIFSTIDLRLMKAFTLDPGRLSVIVECFNCMNDPNYYNNSTTSTWGNGQTPVSTFGGTNPTNFTRTFQFALRFDF